MDEKLSYRVQVLFTDTDMIRIREHMRREGIRAESTAIRSLVLKALPGGTDDKEVYQLANGAASTNRAAYPSPWRNTSMSNLIP